MVYLRIIVILTISVGAYFVVQNYKKIPPLVSIPGWKASKPEIDSIPVEKLPLPEKWAKAEPEEILEEAIARVHPSKVQWLQLEFFQQFILDGLVCETKGHINRAPNQRLHLKLRVKAGEGESTLSLLCDGHQLLETSQLLDCPPISETTSLPQILDPSDDPAGIAKKREALLEEKGFRSIWPLLKGIQSGVKDPVARYVRVREKEYILIEGGWEHQEEKLSVLPKYLKPKSRICQVRLFLRPDNLWVERIEWGGLRKADKSLQTLMLMEFRNAIINQPFSPQETAKLFSLQ